MKIIFLHKTNWMKIDIKELRVVQSATKVNTPTESAGWEIWHLLGFRNRHHEGDTDEKDSI